MFHSRTNRRRFLGMGLGAAMTPSLLSFLSSCAPGKKPAATGGRAGRESKLAHGAGQ